jgi:flagellin
MGLFVNTNFSSLNSQRNLFNSTNSLEKSFERLSSGFRINRASDDAAGLRISNRLVSQIEGINQGIRNANDATSLTQVAEGALNETTTALQRIRTLAIQAQNGINSSSDRAALQQEVTALVAELSRIGASTEFAGNSLLNGSFAADFQVGANAGQKIEVNLSRTGGFGASGLGVGTVNISTTSGASAALTAIDSALEAVGAERSELGALENRFQSTIRNLGNVSDNLSAANSRIRDVDFAKETANLTRMQIMQQVSASILAQSNQSPQLALSLLR